MRRVYFKVAKIVVLVLSPVAAFSFVLPGAYYGTSYWNYSVPFFSESRAALTLRFNPASTAASDPVLRDVIASMILVNISDEKKFDRSIAAFGGQELMMPAYRGTIGDNRKALGDVGGWSESVADHAEDVGLVGGELVSLLRDLTPAAMAEGVRYRGVLRKSLRHLTAAGYQTDVETGLLNGPDGKAVSLDIVVSQRFLSRSQAHALEEAASRLGSLGIRVSISRDYNGTLLSFSLDNDVELAVTGVGKSVVLPDFQIDAWEGTPVHAFIEGLGVKSLSEEVSAYILLDEYMTSEAYVVALSKTAPVVDYALRENRSPIWRQSEANGHVLDICDAGNWPPAAFLRAEIDGEFWFGSAGSPFVFSLPSGGGLGAEMRIGIVAAETDVAVAKRGLLRFDLSGDRKELGKFDVPVALREIAEGRDYYNLRVTRAGNILVLDRPDLYIDVVDAVFLGRSDDLGMPVEFLTFKEGTNRARRAKDVSESFLTHKFSEIQQCAAKVFRDDRALVFSDRASP